MSSKVACFIVFMFVSFLFSDVCAFDIDSFASGIESKSSPEDWLQKDDIPNYDEDESFVDNPSELEDEDASQQVTDLSTLSNGTSSYTCKYTRNVESSSTYMCDANSKVYTNQSTCTSNCYKSYTCSQDACTYYTASCYATEATCRGGSFNSTYDRCESSAVLVCPETETTDTEEAEKAKGKASSADTDTTDTNGCETEFVPTCQEEYSYSSGEDICTSSPVCTTGSYNSDTKNCWTTCEWYKCPQDGFSYRSDSECKAGCASFICSSTGTTYTSEYNCESECKESGTCSNYSSLTEYFESTCPDDPTYNGKCTLESTTTDTYSCQTIEGQEVCKDWWEKEYSYDCGDSFDEDAILAEVGTKYCEYISECSEWTEESDEGGEVTCRQYVDTNRDGCTAESYTDDCIADECGDMWDRCEMTNYTSYSDIKDEANPSTDTDCTGWDCGDSTSSTSGVSLGIYYFNCPSESWEECNTYTGKLVCPCNDGSDCPDSGVCEDGTSCVETACSKVKTCTAEGETTSTNYEMNSCTATRTYTEYSYVEDSSEASSTKDNDSCIKTGETSGCDESTGCCDSGSYGKGSFVHGTSSNDDWGYITMTGLGGGQAQVYVYAAGGKGSCGTLSTQITVENTTGNLIGYVYPHWGGDCQTVPVYYDGYSCSGGGGCIHNFRIEYIVTSKVKVALTRTMGEFKCYEDSYEDCSFSDEYECTRLSGTDISQLVCVEYDTDVDDSSKTQCKSYTVYYNCASSDTETSCTEYEEKIVCSGASYPISEVTVESEDYSTEFTEATSYAQATNELKHVWTGEDYKCEDGYWWLFDTQSLWDYLESKLISMAVSYLGSELISKTGITDAISEGLGCTTSLVSTLRSAYGAENVRVDDEGYVVVTTTGEGGAVTETKYANTEESKSCLAQIGEKVGTSLGLSAEQAAKVTDFFSNTYVLLAINIVWDIVSSIDNCSTCTDEECATTYNEYKAYSLINGDLCHYVDTKCEWEGVVDCWRTGYKYCCYDSMFARILVEQSYSQLGYTWGDYDNPSCSNLTFDDLSKIDFSSMDFSEYIDYLETKMHSTISEEELESKIWDYLE